MSTKVFKALLEMWSEAERNARVDAQNYDYIRVEQLVTSIVNDRPTTHHEQRMIYDTSQDAKHATSHEAMVGGLSKDERMNVLEYLKTL